MKDRIMQLMKNQGMTQQEFSRASGISPASLSSIFTERTSPTMKHAEALHRSFPRLNIQWLLFGEGDMFLPDPAELIGSGEGTDDMENAQSGGSDRDAFFAVSGPGMSPSDDGRAPMGYGNATAGGTMNAAGGAMNANGGVMSTGANAMMKSSSSMSPLTRAKNNNVMPDGYAKAAEGASQGAMNGFSGHVPGCSDGRGFQGPYFGAYPEQGGIANFSDIRRRKIVEIRIFFDDGTFETFKGND